MSKENQFIKLKFSEMIPRYNSIVEEKSLIKIWKSGDVPFLFQAYSFKIQDGFPTLTLLKNESDVNFSNDEIFYSFKFNQLYYFGKGKYLADDEKYSKIILNEQVYKKEGRDEERLLTFPNHQMYALFHFKNAEEFKSKKEELVRESKENFEFKEMKPLDISNQSFKNELDSQKDKLSFRVLDLSSRGVSFLIRDDEKSFFSEKEFQNFEIWNQEDQYLVEKGRVIYIADIEDVNLFKIAISFDSHKKIEELLKKEIEKDNYKNKSQEDFEKMSD